MDLGLRGKSAIVGGSSQGIGYAIAFELAREGASVTLFARKAEQLHAAAEKIRKETGAQVHAVAGDWSKAEDNRRLVDEAVATFGRLDVLVNNDGAPPLGNLLDFDDVAWSRALDRNFMSVVRMVRLAVPHMRAAGAGRIVNITATSVKQPLATYGLSVASWAAVLGYAKTLSLEIGRDAITINTILPGRTHTERLEKVLRFEAQRTGQDYEELAKADTHGIPVGHAGMPEDIAGIVTFLASERARYITGTTIQVDGGSVRNLL